MPRVLNQPHRGSAYSGDTRVFWMPDSPPTSVIAYRGAPQTIAVMRRAIIGSQSDFATRNLAEMICEGLDSKDYTSEYLALYHYILGHSRYMRDPRQVELVRSPEVISKQLLEGRRPNLDCDDMALWLASAVLAVGGYAELVTVAFQDIFFDGRRQYSHVFPIALEPRTRQKIVLDCVAAEKTPQMLARVKAAETWPIAA